MIPDLSRRALLRSSALVPVAAALAACGAVTETTTNGVTTVTVNVAQIDAWGRAFANGAKLIAGLPGLSGTATGLGISAVAAVVEADLAAFDKASGGSVSLAFNSTSVPAAVASLLADGKTLATDAAGALGNVASTAVQTAQTYIIAVETVVSLFQAAVGSIAVGAAVGGTRMSEAQALTALGVSK